MQRNFKLVFLVLMVIIFAVSSCSTSKKGSCGCPNKKGFVGY